MEKNKRMKDLDLDVKYVFDDHPVYIRIREQIKKGLIKYNTPVMPDHYSVFGWFEHIQQEETDKIVYNELMLMKLEEVVKSLQMAKKSYDIETVNDYVDKALRILLDHKEGNE